MILPQSKKKSICDWLYLLFEDTKKILQLSLFPKVASNDNNDKGKEQNKG